MPPSLEGIFDEKFPPETRDELADLEDMAFSELTLGVGVGPSQRGWVVKVDTVDLEKGEHCVILPSGNRRWFRNDKDVYAPLNK